MGRRRRGARLEMTSLMDVMFLVLVFFIYCIFDMSVHRGVKVALPETVGTEEKGERLIVTIASDDALQLNGVSSTREEIVRKVGELVAVKMCESVLISGDRRASLGLGVELLGDLKRVGVEKVSFQVSGKGR